MNRILLLLFIIFVSHHSYSQFNESAPWMRSALKKSSKNKITLKEQSKAFNNYWADKDFTKKGSGFKPFKRWENHWKDQLLENGTIATPDMMWKAWKQKQGLAKSNISNWESLGPYTTNVKSGQGRVNTFIIDPNNPSTFYVGAPAGGIWKSTDNGINWTPLSDQLPQIGVSGIAIDPNNSNIIYISTGDDDARDTYSVGVFKSTDGGTTWNQTGLALGSSSATSNEIYIHPTNSDILWVATSQGFYKSTDAGANWSRKINNNIKDFKLKPGDPNTIYAVSTSKFFKSTDGGDSFTVITSGLPESDPVDNDNKPSRFAVEVSPADANVVYVLSAKQDQSFQGLYKSTNSGDSFTKTAETDDIFGGSDQAWYDMSLTVSPTNANIVLVGVLDIWRSDNGGDNFTQKNHWWETGSSSYTHADIHFLRFFNGKLYAGTDGGIYESPDNANSFKDLTENLNISQYYRISVAKNTSANIAGGLQDNGGFGYSNNTWHNYHGGDGMDNVVDPNNKNTYYGFTQFGGSLNISNDGGATDGGTVTTAPDSETSTNDNGGNWITPLAANNEGVLYAGYSKLYKLNNNAWEEVTTSAFIGDLDHFRISNTNKNIIYASISKSLFKSTDGGITFEKINFVFRNPISSIDINNNDENIIYISNSGFSGKIFKSVDSGENWIDITKNLPNEPKLVIKHQIHSLENDLFVGTSLGVYHINDTMNEWEVFDKNLPNVPVKDIEFSIEDQKIIVATYGRGVWQSPIEVKKANMDISLLEINSNNSTQCNGISPIITVKNNGQNSFNKIEINYLIDDEPFQFIYNGNLNVDEIKEITLPDHDQLALGSHTFKVEVLVNNDTFSDNNKLKGSFSANKSSDGQYVNTFGDVNPDEWISYNPGSSEQLWVKVISTTTKFNKAFENAYITGSRSNYTDQTTSYLVSPCYDLTQMENPVLKFDMVFDIEKDWDVLYMEYTLNSGETWEILGTANDPNWYNSDYINPERPITVGKQWTGKDTTVKKYSYNLAEFTNEPSIIFRFVFASDEAENGEGAAIDNFVIDATAILAVKNNTLENFKIYPNPSLGIFNIQRQSSMEMQVNVYDITGKLVFKDRNILNNHYALNLSHLNKGLYFLKIIEGNKQAARQIMVK